MSPSPNPPRESDPKTGGEGVLSLWELCRRLLSPDGCPWDREQTLETLTPYMVEETYEILDSVSAADRAAIGEELGDLLFLLIMCTEKLREDGGPDLDAIASAAEEKLRRRHPHVFESPETITAGDQQRRWQELKQAEQKTESVLGKMPKGSPSLTAAYRTQEKAASVGFDWPRVEPVLAKIEEELAEVRQALAGRERDGGDGRTEREEKRERALRHEIGDLLFAATNLARFLRIDPERELRHTIARFRSRFAYMESRLKERGTSPSMSDLEEMDSLWEEAKRRERSEETRR